MLNQNLNADGRTDKFTYFKCIDPDNYREPSPTSVSALTLQTSKRMLKRILEMKAI